MRSLQCFTLLALIAISTIQLNTSDDQSLYYNEEGVQRFLETYKNCDLENVINAVESASNLSCLPVQTKLNNAEALRRRREDEDALQSTAKTLSLFKITGHENS